MPQPSSSKRLPDPGQPVRLLPAYIPKPWGQEIWYTGMEVRGESQVALGGGSMPISQYLATDPQALTRGEDLLLLKVLDPAADEVTGDLYFEVHEYKQEVYVVTAVDTQAWPDGRGRIRFGMNQQLRQQYADDRKFRAAYLQAVGEYEALRRRIDDPVARHQADIPAAQEQQARSKMEAFTNLRTLAVGDVVRVPTWTPHALQHGVRVVEFQTPTYQRFIISFAQKVLTQDHWDSEHAVAHMHLGQPPVEKFVQISPGVEQIATFDDFGVWRVNLAAAGSLVLPSHIPYAVCMSLADDVQAGALTLRAEQACFVPYVALASTSLSLAARRTTTNSTAGHLLIAAPGL